MAEARKLASRPKLPHDLNLPHDRIIERIELLGGHPELLVVRRADDLRRILGDGLGAHRKNA